MTVVGGGGGRPTENGRPEVGNCKTMVCSRCTAAPAVHAGLGSSAQGVMGAQRARGGARRERPGVVVRVPEVDAHEHVRAVLCQSVRRKALGVFDCEQDAGEVRGVTPGRTAGIVGLQNAEMDGAAAVCVCVCVCGLQMASKAELDVPAIDTSSHCSSASSLHHIQVLQGDFPGASS